MDSKTLHVLDFPKILARLADFCDFSASAELARDLTPTPDFDVASIRLAETSEALKLLVTSDLTRWTWPRTAASSTRRNCSTFSLR
jgi:dsDNA-specific endonuclease/ATPase MutS2